MDQRHMHPEQLAHRTHNSPPFDMLHSSLYPYSPFPAGDRRAIQPPHPSLQYVQQQYAPDSDPPLEAHSSPRRQYHLQEHPQQGHPHLGDPAPSPALQQPQPRPATAYPLLPQGHEGHNPALQDLYPQPSRALAHQPPQHLSIDTWYFNALTADAGAQPRMGISHLYSPTYAHHPQQRYSLPTTHPSAVAHPPPETSPTTAVPGPSPTFHEQRDNSTNSGAGQRSRLWGGAGALNPATGVFSQESDHPRIRTAQACEKCRTRKAKCSGDHPTCQRCHARGLECAYAPERRMRGPNKPKPPPAPLPDGSQPPAAAAEGQKTRRRASTMPSAPPRGSLVWGQQQQQQRQKHRQNQHQYQGAVAMAASPASSASSAGSGSFGYPPPSESEASPMTPHSSLGSRRPSAAGLSTSPQVLVHDFSAAATMRPGVLDHVSGNGYEDDGVTTAEGVVTTGVYAQDLPDMRLSLESAKALF